MRRLLKPSALHVAMPVCGGTVVLTWSGPALAHASERGQVMLLPTAFYMIGGGLAVLASVLLVAMLPVITRWRLAPRTITLPALPPVLAGLPSAASLILLLLLVGAGLAGPADPISNPLPGFIWSLWWVGFALVCAVFGDLWPLLNPWRSLLRLMAPARPLLRYPASLGCWPAVLMLAAFAWLELVDPAPDDPARLAGAVIAYVLFNLAGGFVFGETQWLGKAEAFSVYFRMVGRVSAFQWNTAPAKPEVHVGVPGHGLLRPAAPAAGETVFVLLALAAVSFDGFSQSFLWMDWLGLNPLEFPGRSAVMGANTAGLLLMVLCLGLAYAASVGLGRMMARTPAVPGLVMAIFPIALAYHCAHYMVELPVDGLRAVKALSDPFGTGLDLLGTSGLNPPASIMMDHATAAFVYRLQTAIIVVGHVMAVVVAHILSLRAGIGADATGLSLAPLNVLMVLYTVFGLWLLSTPVIG